MQDPEIDDSVVRPYWAGDDDGWAYGAIDSVMRAGGPDAVRVIEMLAAGAPDTDALRKLGAGFLEDLVRWHGLALAAELGAALERQPRLRVAVSVVRVGVEQLESDSSFVRFYGLEG
jgi:hypothetical protein